MTPERLAEIRQFVMRYGPANCWTGTLGTACEYILEMLKELQGRKGQAVVDAPTAECQGQ